MAHPTETRPEPAGAPLFAATVFLSAFLLFLVQPLLARFVMPWLGGGAAVWVTSLAFFQTALVVGYALAHAFDGPLRRWQVPAYGALLLLSLVAIPLRPAVERVDTARPASSLLLVLTLTVGLPYVALASSGPMLQRWYARSFPHRPPYRMYALSNLGSLLALLAYPFAVEPLVGRTAQALGWSVGYGVLVGLALLCAARARGNLLQDSSAGLASGSPLPQVGVPVLLTWVALAAAASAVLVAATTQLTRDVVMPLLWVLPLALYLLSFILCFESDRWYRRDVTIAGLFFATMLADIARVAGAAVPVWGMAGIFGGLVLFAGLLCHGELARRRPPASRLTLYYLTLTVGGAVGGLAAAIAAPRLLDGDWEFEAAVTAVWALVAITELHRASRRGRPPVWLAAMIVAGVLVPAVSVLRMMPEQQLHSERSFYGALSVSRAEIGEDEVLQLHNGRILHGLQFVEPSRGDEPTTYYSRESGIGVALSAHPRRREGRSLSVAVIGLGVGTIAALAQPGDEMTFYELDPNVEPLARRWFSYLEESAAVVRVVSGDARVRMAEQARRGERSLYDVIAVDAFSSDAIPTHLLTLESADLYVSLLRPGGILAVHVSNRFVDLVPVVEGIGRHLGARVGWVRSDARQPAGISSALWGLIATDAATGSALAPLVEREPPDRRAMGWTDELNSVLPVLRPW